ncbi:MAG: YncE family protein, partial [Chitinispirillaceae bacterium]|nr:YncE family protein [Chitinispirillaceae bacterium]
MMRLITLILFIFITNFLTGVRSFADDFTETVAPPSVIFEVLALNKDLPTLKKPKYRSPTDMATSPDETKIYICEQTAKRITVFDVGTKTVEPDRIRLPNEVTGCVVSNDHTKLFATIGSEWWPTGYVCVVDMASRRVTNRIPAGHYPRCPVLSPDGTMLYIANMFSNDVTVIDVGTETVAKTIDVVREPYSMGITPDGKTLIVGNSLPDERSTDTMFVSCKVSIIDLASGTQDTIRLTHGHSRGSHSVYGLTVEPTGRYAFVTHLIGKFYLVASTVEKGWLQTNNLAMIDIKERKFINDVSLDLLNCGLANPWGVKCTRDGQYMIIAHAGANELSLINLPRMIDTVLARSAKGEDLQREFTVLKECRKRLQVITKGPRALAIAGTSVFTTGYFDDAAATMEEFLLDTSRSRPIGTYVIGEPQPWNGERNGENNFFDASLCFQKWQSCHSCHPFTRPCALNWILGGGA